LVERRSDAFGETDSGAAVKTFDVTVVGKNDRASLRSQSPQSREHTAVRRVIQRQRRNQMTFRAVVTVWFDKGYGFAVSPDRKQFFLHVKGLADQSILPKEGDLIEFEISSHPQRKGGLPLAVNAVIIPAEKGSEGSAS
jgi:hypothetical protein